MCFQFTVEWLMAIHCKCFLMTVRCATSELFLKGYDIIYVILARKPGVQIIVRVQFRCSAKWPSFRGVSLLVLTANSIAV